MMLVVSRDGRYRAELKLRPGDDGVEVTIWRVGERTHNSSKDMRRLHKVGVWLFACPMHVALDEVSNLVDAMSHVANGTILPVVKD